MARIQHMGQLLNFIPVLEQGNFGEWSKTGKHTGTREDPYILSHVIYSDNVSAFIECLYALVDTNPQLDLYQYRDILSKNGLQWNDDSIRTADVSEMDMVDILALFMSVLRMDHFCDGVLLEYLEDGFILRWLKQLQYLYYKTDNILFVGGSVRCSCFQERQVNPCPVPLDDVFADEHGFFHSHKLTEIRKTMSPRQYYARYVLLDKQFQTWSQHPCKHEDSEYCYEELDNCQTFFSFIRLVTESEESQQFPWLYVLLQSVANETSLSADIAQKAMVEFEQLVRRYGMAMPKIIRQNSNQMQNLLVASVETGNPIQWATLLKKWEE